jgi:hypothetical protein
MSWLSKASKSVSHTISNAVGNSKLATVAKKVVGVQVAAAAGVIGGFATGGPVGAIAGGVAGATKGVIEETKTGKAVLNTKLLYQSGFTGVAAGAVAGTVAGVSGHAANAGITGKFGGVLRNAFSSKVAAATGETVKHTSGGWTAGGQVIQAGAKAGSGGFWGTVAAATLPSVFNQGANGGGAAPESGAPPTNESGGSAGGGTTVSVISPSNPSGTGPGITGPDSNPNLTPGYGGVGQAMGGINDLLTSAGQAISQNQNWIWIAVIGVIGFFLLRKKKFA